MIGPRSSIFIFAAGSIALEDGCDALVRRLAACGFPGWAMHLGCATPALRLRGADGALDVGAIGEFVARLPEELGGYGSWWGETEHTLRLLLTGLAARVPADIWLFVRDAGRPPPEWDTTRFAAFLAARRKWRPLDDRLHLVARTAATPPFVVEPWSSVTATSKWLDGSTPEGDA